MRKLRRKSIVLWVFIGTLLLLSLWILWGNTALEINEHTVTSSRLPKGFNGFRIAQVSDLHNSEFGKDNEILLAMLKETRPDIIVITGDLVDGNRPNMGISLAFAEKAVEIAPCYYVPGNHESALPDYDVLTSRLTAAGVVVLENQRLELERNGDTLILIGMMDPAFLPGASRGVPKVLEELCHNIADYTILLSHRPELFRTYVEYGVDLVFSGHAHGGQFRLPIIGGLAAPHQGLFPAYDSGLYTRGFTNMLVSRGIGNSSFPFRFNNRPEILVAELHSA